MRWLIEDRVNQQRLDREFTSPDEADTYMKRLGDVIAGRMRVVVEADPGDHPMHVRMLTEGLVRGDLRDILLPRLSIDEYVSADPNSDNVVIAFFVKGVPEAVMPLKNFCDHCEGVSLADYANSETIENCSIVYAEMDRPTLRIENILELLEQVCLIAEMEPSDFTLTFPNTQRKYPFEVSVIKRYFQYRSEEKSKEAQKMALAKDNQQEPGQAQPDRPEEEGHQDQQVQESLIEKMIEQFGLSHPDLKSISDSF